MKTDTKLGKLIDVAIRHIYGDDFRWDSVNIVDAGNGEYLVEMDLTPERHINPVVVCFQMCKHLRTINTEDGEAVYCDIEGNCPMGKWEPTVKI